MSNIICGTLRKKKKFYFSFDRDSKILTIQPAKMEKFFYLFPEFDFEKYPYLRDRIDIDGETNSETYIRFIEVKFSSIGRGCFQAWVPAYIIGRSNGISPVAKPNLIKNISFKGECIDRFMSSKCTVTDKWDRDNSKLELKVDCGKDKIKSFNYNNLTFKLIPGGNMTTVHKDVNNVLTMQTSLVINSENNLNVKSIINIYKDVEKLFSFICYRQHVKFDSIILTQTEPVLYGNTLQDTTINFELFVSSDDEKYDLPKVGRNMILTDYIDKIPLLLSCIKNNEFMLLSFPNNSLMESIIDNNKYINISSAFESEFDLLNPKFKSNRKKYYNDAKVFTLNYLKNQKNNRKNYNSQIRNYFNDLYNFIDNCEGRLEEQIDYALKKYDYIVESDRKYYESKYPNIDFSNYSLAKSFSNKRNYLSHGSKLDRFKILEIASYTIIRKINYAMILERAEFSNDQIKKIINNIL